MRALQTPPPPLVTAWRQLFWAIVLAAVVVLVACPASANTFYKYVDDKGIAHFVDDESAVPPQYRSQLKRYTDGTEKLTPQQLDAHNARQAAKERSAQKAIERQMESLRQQEKKPESKPNPMLTQVAIANNQVVVPVTIGYRGRQVDAKLILDTGANVVVLYKSIGDRLGILWPKGIRAQVAGGAEIKAGKSRLSFIKMGGITMKNVMAAIVPEQSDSLTHDGLLGMNVLKHFDYRIDFDRNAIEWRPRLSTGAR